MESSFDQAKTSTEVSPSRSSQKIESSIWRLDPFTSIGSIFSKRRSNDQHSLPQFEKPNLLEGSLKNLQSGTDEKIFLLLCIDRGQYATKLTQLNLDIQQSDHELLKVLKREYQIAKGIWTSTLSLRGVSSIDFVEVSDFSTSKHSPFSAADLDGLLAGTSKRLFRRHSKEE